MDRTPDMDMDHEHQEHFVEDLKTLYLEGLASSEEQWPPVRGDKLVSLKLVETETKHEGFQGSHTHPIKKVKQTSIHHNDLFKVEEGKKPIRKILVEGIAGIGKTTLCTMLVEGWANREMLTQFQYVLFIRLREDCVSSAKCLLDLVRELHSSISLCSSVVECIEKKNGQNVLIIADGWDELEEDKRSKHSFLYKLVHGQCLRLASIILTSRPSAAANLHNFKSIHRIVEVAGFNEENIELYIDSEFQNEPLKGAALVEQLKGNPLIQSICSVPLNCAILCNVWYTMSAETLPRTLTELYTLLVLNIVLRNIKKDMKCQVHINLALHNFDTIPHDLQEIFWQICKFSFDCLCRNQIVFSKEELQSFFPEGIELKENFLCFGLLQSSQSPFHIGHERSFHFPHSTIQEFLAALHFLTLSSVKMKAFCQKHARSSQFGIMWRFVFGLGCKNSSTSCAKLTGVHKVSKRIITLDDAIVDTVVSILVPLDLVSFRLPYGRSSINPDDQPLLLCHCALESKDTVICEKVSKQISNITINGACSPFDCLAITYALKHTMVSTITINMSCCNLDDKHLSEVIDLLSNKAGKLTIESLVLSNNKITENGIVDLFKGGASCLDSLQYLFLDSNNLRSIAGIYNHISLSKLTWLALSNNPLGESGIEGLAWALHYSDLSNLSHLELRNTLTDDPCLNEKILNNLFNSLSNCFKLEHLDLSKNNLGLPGACALGKALPQLALLKLTLKLCDVKFDKEAMISFSSHALDELYSNQMICIFGMSPSCCSLEFDDNPLGCEGVIAAFKLLGPEKCNIRFLSLRNVGIVDSIGVPCELSELKSCQAGPLDSRLNHCLHLDHNDFSGDKIFVLAQCLKIYLPLESLSTGYCCLSSIDIINLLSLIKCYGCCESLKTWDISNNKICDSGIVSIIECIPDLFPNLQQVTISNNLVSKEVKKRLTTFLRTIRKVIYLNTVKLFLTLYFMYM